MENKEKILWSIPILAGLALMWVLSVNEFESQINDFCVDEGFERYDLFQEDCLKNKPIRRVREPACIFQFGPTYNCSFYGSYYDWPSDKEYCEQLGWDDIGCKRWKELQEVK